MSDTWRHLEDRRSHVEQVRENSSRPGRAWATHATTGVGGIVHPTVFDFRCSFVSMPIFTFGAVLNDNSTLPTDPYALPRCTAGVYDWKRSASGMYTGAWCWFTVDSSDDLPTLGIIFTMAWEGIISKDFISTPGFPVNKLDV